LAFWGNAGAFGKADDDAFLAEGEEDTAGGGLGIVLKTVVAPVHRC
jgi:hypothetical protein